MMLAYPASFTFISDEVSQDPAAVVAFARRHGFGGFELRSMFGRQFRDLTQADVREIRQRADDAGLRVLGCATPVFKCRLDVVSECEAHRDIFRRSVETAQALDCRLLRVFSFLRRSDRATDDDLARAAAEINALLPLCPETIRLGVENEASCIAGTGEELERLLQGNLASQVGIIWDPCNVLYVSSFTDVATAGFAPIGGKLAHVHVKDARREIAGPVACPVGMGDVGWPRHFQEIEASGYAGLFSLETHWRRQALDPGELHLPGGFGFSAGGEAASETCLARIRQMVARV